MNTYNNVTDENNYELNFEDGWQEGSHPQFLGKVNDTKKVKMLMLKNL